MPLVSVKTFIAPKEPIPTKINALTVETFWQVDEYDWEESAFDPLYDGYLEGGQILDTQEGEELEFGVTMNQPDTNEIIEEVCCAIAEYAEEQEYYNEHIDEYDGCEDQIFDEMNFTYDYRIVEAACDALYGVSGQEMTIEDLKTLSNTNNWFEVKSRELTVIDDEE